MVFDAQSKKAPSDFWKEEYKLIANWQAKKADRKWTRFQMSLFLNGGLLTAYSAILALGSRID